MTSNPRHGSLPVNNVLKKIRDLTSDLQAIQQELCRELALPDGTPRKNVTSAGAHSADDLGMLKATVDQFRRVLWFYVDQTEQKLNTAGPTPPYSQEMQAKSTATASLKLQESAGEAQQTASFFDRLELVIESYLQPSGPLAAYRKTPKSQ